jgi:transaldolase
LFNSEEASIIGIASNNTMPKKNIKDLIKKKQTKKAEEGNSESAKKEEEDQITTSTLNQADASK